MAAPSHLLRVALQDHPEVFREIEIASDKKLVDLAKAIVSAFDFQFDHARIAEAFPEVGHTMLFLFDYGDDWRFVVEVIGRGEWEPKVRYPRVLKKQGASRAVSRVGRRCRRV